MRSKTHVKAPILQVVLLVIRKYLVISKLFTNTRLFLIYPFLIPRFECSTLQTHPCNENRDSSLYFSEKNLFESPGNPVMKTGVSLCGKSTQGKPCSGRVLSLYGIAVHLGSYSSFNYKTTESKRHNEIPCDLECCNQDFDPVCPSMQKSLDQQRQQHKIPDWVQMGFNFAGNQYLVSSMQQYSYIVETFFSFICCAKAHYFCRPSTCQVDSLYQGGN